MFRKSIKQTFQDIPNRLICEYENKLPFLSKQIHVEKDRVINANFATGAQLFYKICQNVTTLANFLADLSKNSFNVLE